jgi:hypothetical protein
MLVTLTLTTFVSYDLKGNIADSLEVGSYYSPFKMIMYSTPSMTGGGIQASITNSNVILKTVTDKFSIDEIDYLVGDLHFTNKVKINQYEALIDINSFKKYFNKEIIGTKDIYLLNAPEIGISNLKLRIVGFTEEIGIFTPLSSMERLPIDESYISVHLPYDFWHNDSTAYLGDGFNIYSLSKLKRDFSPKFHFFMDLQLDANEIILSNQFTSVFRKDENNHLIIPPEMYFNNNEKKILSSELNETLLNVGKYYENGAKISFILPDIDDILRNTIIVNDNVYSNMIQELKSFLTIGIKCSEKNRGKIASLFIDNNYIFTGIDNTQRYIMNIYSLTHDNLIVFSFIIGIFVLGSLIVISLFSSTILISKKNEIGLLQCFGLTKFKSIIPAISTVVLSILFSFILSYGLSPFILEEISETVIKGNENFEGLTIIGHNISSILLNILILISLILLSFLFNLKKITKYSAKDIFKLN